MSLCIQCKQRQTIPWTTQWYVDGARKDVEIQGSYCKPCGDYARRMEYGPCTLEEMIDHQNGVIDSFSEEWNARYP